MSLSSILSCFTGPRLYRMHKNELLENRNYNANAIESVADGVVRLFGLTCSISMYASPIIITYFYRRGYLSKQNSPENLNFFFRLGSTLGFIFISAICLRCFGRYGNVDYYTFISKLEQARSLSGSELKKKITSLREYDFDFSYWPVEFKANQSKFMDPKRVPRTLQDKSSGPAHFLDTIKKVPCDIFGFIAVCTFGRRMVYPGSVGLLQNAIDPALRQGRNRLIENFHGRRVKLETLDGNHIDSMFIDRRRMSKVNGKTLVITCEGNAGFYEIGTMGTPIAAGYSVLGWNAPGFVGSSGSPYPDQIINAIDTVIKFAVDELEFKLDDIIIFAWSIGGFPATWAAMEYPKLKGIILDASFDDILPLALSKMPPSWKLLVTSTVRGYFNLNNSKQLSHYNGPVLLVRRTNDEIIFTNERDPLKSNRANDLLIKLFQNRFPNLMNSDDAMWALLDWLSGAADHQSAKMDQYGVNEETCLTLLKSYMEKEGPNYPLNIGENMDCDLKVQLVLYLASKHFINYDSTHCMPLPTDLFIQPWDLLAINNSDVSRKNYGKL